MIQRVLHKKVILISLVAVVFLCILTVNIISQYRSSFRNPHQPAFDFVYDFAMALRLNNEKAYEMVEPTLHPRIDEWLITHEVSICIRENSEPFTGGGRMEDGFDVSFSCFTKDGGYFFRIHDVFVKELGESFIITDWGEVIEELP